LRFLANLMSMQNRQHAGVVTMVTYWLRCAAGVIANFIPQDKTPVLGSDW